MRNLMSLSVLSLAFAALPSLVQADCGCGGSAQSYQRYSYQPAQAAVVAPAAPIATAQPAATPAPAPMATAPVVSQNYRRFSYQPTARNFFTIPKGDTRRYTH